MDSLELEAPVDEVQPSRAVHIHRSTQLLLCERFRCSEVRRRHAPVREGDLHMERHGRDMADQNEGDAEGPGGDGRPDEAIAEEIPVAGHTGNLDRPSPSAAGQAGSFVRDEVTPR